MRIEATSLPGVLLLEPDVIRDERGYLFESYNRRVLAAAGLAGDFVQDNQSRSARNVVRGLHYQLHQPQGKLVRVIEGEIFDVAVDLRRSSPGFGRWVGQHLSADNRRMVWIPAGFAHGFLAISQTAEVLYKVTDYYAPGDQRCLRWDDPDVNIEWPLTGPASVSEKDAHGVSLKSAETFR